MNNFSSRTNENLCPKLNTENANTKCVQRRKKKNKLHNNRNASSCITYCSYNESHMKRDQEQHWTEYFQKEFKYQRSALNAVVVNDI